MTPEQYENMVWMFGLDALVAVCRQDLPESVIFWRFDNTEVIWGKSAHGNVTRRVIRPDRQEEFTVYGEPTISDDSLPWGEDFVW